MFEKSDLDELSYFKFGHADDQEAGTGCTVFVAPEGARCGVDISGGGPATRETDLLRPENMIQDVHAIVLSGGSAFGLEASCGVMDALSKRDIGFPMADDHIPIVTSACIFDLTVGKNIHPDKTMGEKAVEAAFLGAPFKEGNVGAGCGASTGKLLGPQQAMKTGFGFEVLRLHDLVVGAFVVLNPVGNIRNPQGGWLAGCRGKDNQIVDSIDAFSAMANPSNPPSMSSNTTLGVIVTNAKLDKAQASKTSSIVNDAYARAIKPVHTSNDGDAIFTFASGEVETLPDLVAIIATEAMEEAIYRAARNTPGAFGLPSAHDLGA